ncbi:VanZ family protein [Agarivorans sp. 1_MG-2023]|uniref:VanZ family protein n=1 Tax=Agarivorans sp. 1_MG-2023 TaxID=3062634 RepID=UPI0026E3A26A|nr:VanZ family protein [Agarivorans sp. 1_MG-2023]MDO6762455.1 VanZ family protein [Agarivorans sp. 1_MG-2023]
MYKFASILALLLFSFILWVIYLANTGASSVFFNVVGSLPYGDKLGHFGLFGTLTFICVLATKFSGLRIANIPIYWGAIAVTVFALGEELSQAYMPTRTFDLVDASADLLGIAAACVCCYFISIHLAKTKAAPLPKGH